MYDDHSTPDASKKRGRGRPRKSEIKPLDAGHVGMGLYCFGKARRRGEKYDSASLIAAKASFSSVAEIKRIRKKLQPEDAAIGFVTIGDFRPLTPLEEDLITYAESHGIGLPRPKNRRILMLGIGPIHRYPRVNARSKPRPSTRKNSQEHSESK